jgi:CheY-like chemotaxis protein
MVEDVLDVSRIVAGKVRLNVQPVSLPELIQQALATARPAADAKRIRLTTRVQPGDAVVAGDPDRLLQVLSNLLSNAIKFTPPGGRIRLTLERTDGGVDVVVADSGMGIRADFLPHIFERFKQAESSVNRQRTGLGLGLAISRNLVEMHGGSIQAASAGDGKGATFRVHLPLLAAAEAGSAEKRKRTTQPPLPSRATLASLAGTHVLAVDNDPDALQLVKEILEAASARVTTASTAQVALDTITVNPPDLVLADVGMPAMDGYEFIKHLRRVPDPTVRSIPAAALTAYARSEDRVKALEDGFQMHLSKPIDPVELVAAVRALARRPSSGRQL